MSFKLTYHSKWQSLWPFHKQNTWERFEPLWFSLIAIATVSMIAFGLRTAITHRIIGEEKLYISPSSYSLESTDFFDSEKVSEHTTDNITFDPFIIPVAQAKTDPIKTNIIIKQ